MEVCESQTLLLLGSHHLFSAAATTTRFVIVLQSLAECFCIALTAQVPVLASRFKLQPSAGVAEDEHVYTTWYAYSASYDQQQLDSVSLQVESCLAHLVSYYTQCIACPITGLCLFENRSAY